MFVISFFLLSSLFSSPVGSGKAVSAWHSSAIATVKPIERKRLSVRVTKPFPTTFENWDGHFSAQSFSSPADKKKLSNIEKDLKTAFAALPKNLTRHLQYLEVRNQDNASRGMANKEKLILNTGYIKNDDELTAVFIHELGHITDLGELTSLNGGATEFLDGKKTVFKNDPSVDFYRLSWKDAKTKKSGVASADFVSGYAATNCFEDFAESFLFYRMHGEKFRFLAKKSSVMQKKYEFMRDKVFQKEEFQKDKTVEKFVLDSTLLWDATLLKIGGF